MYLNHKTILKKGLSANDILLFDCINQQTSDNNMEEYIRHYLESDRDIEILEEKEYTKEIKGTTKQSLLHKLRLTKKGKDLLKQIQEADVDEFALQLRDWVVDLYKKQDKKTKNKKRLAWQIAQFEANVGVTKNHLAYLIQQFILDSDNMEYNHISNYMFEDPKNLYFKGFRKEDSRLYHYYIKRQEYFNNQFKSIPNGK